MSYHLTGIASAFFFLLCLYGIWTQLELIEQRRIKFRDGRLQGEMPTAILSLNQFTMSFLAFFSFLVYGISVEKFNHYLVWPRLTATGLTLVVLYQIMIDRRDLPSKLSFWICSGGFLFAICLLFYGREFAVDAQGWFKLLVVVVTFLLAQGYLHQVLLIRKSGMTGGVSIRMHQMMFLKDLSTAAFSCTMGFANGWPVLLLSTVSGATKAIILWHFRWARQHPTAVDPRVEPPLSWS